MAYKILVVDDEPDVVAFLETTLRSEGFDVVSAYDGITALDVCSSEKPDLVLLDIMMPMMSGYEVCEQIKANPLTQHIPVLCISSAHSPEARAHCFRVGAVELLKKPFLPAELIAQVKRHLKESGKPML
ncbi:MAG TPA: response regulator [Candidatus Hydrogenedentes bacterium]|nr:response regulator [Candidatus Hydrogenedentota bacterium]HOJ70028.1 response regulator [Candidatus Hydrogenedentota bacterium]HOK88893.1 response regulator [Candidatus Hydrogenedentota bacterium]HOV60957.1 response regulator [Candidatus Hydrogenedentota bacterium]